MEAPVVRISHVQNRCESLAFGFSPPATHFVNIQWKISSFEVYFSVKFISDVFSISYLNFRLLHQSKIDFDTYRLEFTGVIN